jgi:hypothetical protein
MMDAAGSLWGLTFDVRGGPLAGRPLDGGVRRSRVSKEMPGTSKRQPSEGEARLPGGSATAHGDFLHLRFAS